MICIATAQANHSKRLARATLFFLGRFLYRTLGYELAYLFFLSGNVASTFWLGRRVALGVSQTGFYWLGYERFFKRFIGKQQRDFLFDCFKLRNFCSALSTAETDLHGCNGQVVNLVHGLSRDRANLLNVLPSQNQLMIGFDGESGIRRQLNILLEGFGAVIATQVNSPVLVSHGRGLNR